MDAIQLVHMAVIRVVIQLAKQVVCILVQERVVIAVLLLVQGLALEDVVHHARVTVRVAVLAPQRVTVSRVRVNVLHRVKAVVRVHVLRGALVDVRLVVRILVKILVKAHARLVVRENVILVVKAHAIQDVVQLVREVVKVHVLDIVVMAVVMGVQTLVVVHAWAIAGVVVGVV